MPSAGNIPAIQTSLGVRALPSQSRNRDDRDDHFRRQMEDIEEEEGRIHEDSREHSEQGNDRGRRQRGKLPQPRRLIPEDPNCHIDFEA